MAIVTNQMIPKSVAILSMVSHESKLCSNCQIRLGQIISCQFHYSNGRSYMAFTNCGCPQEKQKTTNLRGLLQTKCCNQKGSISFTIHGKGLKYGGQHEVYFFLDFPATIKSSLVLRISIRRYSLWNRELLCGL